MMPRSKQFLFVWTIASLVLVFVLNFVGSFLHATELLSLTISFPILGFCIGKGQAYLLRRFLGREIPHWLGYTVRGSFLAVIMVYIFLFFASPFVFDGLASYGLTFLQAAMIFSFFLSLSQAFAFPKWKQRLYWIGACLVGLFLQYGIMLIITHTYREQMQYFMVYIFVRPFFSLASILIGGYTLLEITKDAPVSLLSAPEQARPRHPKSKRFLVLWTMITAILFFPWMGFIVSAFPNFLVMFVAPVTALLMAVLQALMLNKLLDWPLRWWGTVTLAGSLAGIVLAFFFEMVFSSLHPGRYYDESLLIPLFSASFLIFRLILALFQSITFPSWTSGCLWILCNMAGAAMIWLLLIFHWDSYPFNAINPAGFVLQVLSAGFNALLLIQLSGSD
jgi:hypothetical protein